MKPQGSYFYGIYDISRCSSKVLFKLCNWDFFNGPALGVKSLHKKYLKNLQTISSPKLIGLLKNYTGMTFAKLLIEIIIYVIILW